MTNTSTPVKWEVVWKSGKKEVLEGKTIQEALKQSARKWINIEFTKSYKKIEEYKMPVVEEVEVLDLPNPADHYLKLVLGKFGNEWGTWLRNDSLGGYNEGNYYQFEESARENLKARMDKFKII